MNLLNSLPASPILLLEDGEDDVALFQKAFEQLGLKNGLSVFHSSGDLLKFIDLQEEFSGSSESLAIPELVLMNDSTAGKSNLSVLQYLRKHPFMLTVPVVVFCKDACKESISRFYSNGCSGLFEKPATAQQYVQVLEAILFYWQKLNTRTVKYTVPG